MNIETTKSEFGKTFRLIQLARKSTSEKDYDKAVGLYKDAIQILVKVAKESGNEQKTELLKTASLKIMEEIRKAEQLKQGSGNEQLGQGEVDQILAEQRTKIIIQCFQKVIQIDQDQPDHKHDTVKEEQKNQNTFQHRYYPNVSGEYIELINELESKMVEPDTNIRLDDITSIGDSIKLVLKESIILPFLYPQLFEGRSCQNNRVLLVGPHPEKMQIIHSLASESKARLFIFSESELFSEWRSNAEKMIRMIFQLGSYYSPAIIYMEDIEVLGSNQDDRTEWRRRVRTEFLVQCHTTSFEVENKETKTKEFKPFIIIGGSENPWEIDTATRRRFEKRLCLNLLNKDDRLKMFQAHLQELKARTGENVNWEYLIKRTEYFSVDDIVTVCKEAVMVSRRIKIQEMDHLQNEIQEVNKNKFEEIIVTQKDFVEALRKINRSILDSDLINYKNWIESFMDEIH